MRKATFKVVNASAHSSAHNSREDMPKYLIEIDKNFTGNYYEQIHTDEDFAELAKEKYKETNKQKMQKKQEVALIKETVLSIEKHHNENDVKKLFQKLNSKYGGHYPLEIAIHHDEGHFVDSEGITYHPNKDIIYDKKEESWYRIPLEKSIDITQEQPPREAYSEKVDITKFKKIYNYHAHVKFSMFDLEKGVTGRMTKGEVSERLKFVANELGLVYEKNSSKRSSKSVRQIKDEHKAIRDIKVQEYLKNKKLKEELEKSKKENQYLSKQIKDLTKLSNRRFKVNKSFNLNDDSIDFSNLFIGFQITKLKKQFNNKQAQYNELLVKYTKLKKTNKVNIKKSKAILNQEVKKIKKQMIQTKAFNQKEYQEINKIKRELEARLSNKEIQISNLKEEMFELINENQILKDKLENFEIFGKEEVLKYENEIEKNQVNFEYEQNNSSPRKKRIRAKK